MSKYQRIYQRMCQSITPDESFCVVCLEPMETLWNRSIVCAKCKKELIIHKRVYRINGIDWYVLYEYNVFIERLFFQLKEQRDIALAPLFLYEEKETLKKWFQSYCVCGLCGSEAKRMERGFEPLELIFSSIDIHMYSPLYKTENVKQSNVPADQRQQIASVLQRKSLYRLPDQAVCLADDVCTTGASMSRACCLLRPQKVFLISAHPLWMEKHRQNVVENNVWIC